MGRKLLLGFEALVWIPFGVLMFARPGLLAEMAGVTSSSVTGTVDLQAMYGGMSVGVGLLAASALARASLARPALTTLLAVTAGLGTARALAAVMAGDGSAYTVTAVAFELGTATAAGYLLARGSPDGAPHERA